MINYWKDKSLMDQSFYTRYFNPTPLTDEREKKIWFNSIHQELDHCFTNANATAEAIEQRESLSYHGKKVSHFNGTQLASAIDSIDTHYQLEGKKIVLKTNASVQADYQIRDPNRLLGMLTKLGFREEDISGINVSDLLICESILFETITKEQINFESAMVKDYSTITGQVMPEDVLQERLQLYLMTLKPIYKIV